MLLAFRGKNLNLRTNIQSSRCPESITASMVLLATIMLLAAVHAPPKAVGDPPALLPTPRAVTWTAGTLPVSALDVITLEAGAADSVAAEELVQALRAHGIAAETAAASPDSEEGIVLRQGAVAAPGGAEADRWVPDEAYRLVVDGDGVMIEGATPRARFYGVATLLQLIDQAQGALPHVTIVDAPRFGWRGISDDISRGQVSTRADFHRLLREMALLKMNVYMPYLEDLVQLEAFPSIGEGRGALSRDEIQDLQAAARRYHVEVIPVFQTLGHYENVLNTEEFAHLAEYPGAASLNTQDSATYDFLQTVLDEVVPLFDSPYFHVGADESWDVGRGASREAADERGVAAVHVEHYRRVFEMMRRNGRQPLMYSDMLLRHPEALAALPDSVIVVDWHYGATDRYPSVATLAEAGQPFVVSPGVRDWNHLYPDHAAAWINICEIAEAGARHGARGVITSSWGDYGAPNLRALRSRGFAYGAECSWAGHPASHAVVDAAFDRWYFGLHYPALAALEQLLTSMTQVVDVRQLWRHPYHVLDDLGWEPLRRAHTLGKEAGTARALVDSLRPQVTRHEEALDLYALVARIYGWHGDVLSFARRTRTLAESDEERRRAEQDDVLAQGCRLVEQTEVLSEAYGEAWRRSNRPANLQGIETLFAYARAHLLELTEAVAAGRWTVDTTLPGTFITAPSVDPDRPQPAYLRTTFAVDPNRAVRRARLQLIGHSEAQAWLNGEPAANVQATRTLSLGVDTQRVRVEDVTQWIRTGTNVLAVRARSYRDGRPAAAHLYLDIEFADGVQQIVVTDTTWSAATEVVDGWRQAPFEPAGWAPAEAASLPRRVTPPLFEHGLKSRIEF